MDSIKIPNDSTLKRLLIKDGNALIVLLAILSNAEASQDGKHEAKVSSFSTALSRQEFRSALKRLQKCYELPSNPTNKATLVSVEDKGLRALLEERPTNKQPTSNQQANQQKGGCLGLGRSV